MDERDIETQKILNQMDERSIETQKILAKISEQIEKIPEKTVYLLKST